jgi:serine/threonine protein kinase
VLDTSGIDWPYVAKVSDFGLSVKVDEFFGHVSNAHHGTPFYMAPEVTRAGFLSMAADSYSFGASSYDL